MLPVSGHAVARALPHWLGMSRGEGWSVRKQQWLERVLLWRKLALHGDTVHQILSRVEIFWRTLAHPAYMAMLARVSRGFCDAPMSDMAWILACEGSLPTPLMSFGLTSVGFDLDPCQMQRMQQHPWGGEGQLGLGQKPDPGGVGVLDMVTNEMGTNESSVGISIFPGFSQVDVNPNTPQLPADIDYPEYYPWPCQVRQYPSTQHHLPVVHLAVPRPQHLMPSYAAYQAIRLWDTKFEGFASHIYACRMASSSKEGPPKESSIGELRAAGSEPPARPRWGGCLQLNTVRYTLQPYPSVGDEP